MWNILFEVFGCTNEFKSAFFVKADCVSLCADLNSFCTVLFSFTKKLFHDFFTEVQASFFFLNGNSANFYCDLK